MACNASFPPVIPELITQVTVYATDFSMYSPDDPSWQNVTHLQIIPDETADGQQRIPTMSIAIPTRAFVKLLNLKYLKIYSIQLRAVASGAFCGLESLEVLDLSDNFELQLSEIVKGMTGCSFTNLHTFSVRGLSRHSSKAPIFDTSFFELFRNSALKSLDMSNIYAGNIYAWQMGKTQEELEYLNLQNSETMSRLFIPYLLLAMTRPQSSFISKMEELNLNYAGALNFDNIDILKVTCCSVFLPTLRKLHLSGFIVSDNSNSVDIQVVEEDGILIVSFIFYPSGNDFRLSIPYPNTLEFVDVSNNYIGHVFINVTKESNLKSINVSHNELFLATPEVLEQSLNFPNLQELVVSHNGLINIARNIFARTPKLQYVDLSYNGLTDFRVRLSDLQNLNLLNLSYNKIHVLSESAMNILTLFFKERSSDDLKNTTENTKILLIGNPFQCSCNSQSFLEWLTLDLTYSFIGTTACASDRSNITKDTVRAIKESCKVNVDLIVGLAVGGLVIVLALTAGIVLRKYCIEIKRRFEIKKRLSKYRIFPTRNIPVFLSYSSKNEDFVQRHVFPELNNRLQRKLNTSAECVSFGDNSFRVGRPLLSEIIRCIEEATVIVCCVSKDFCESHWCKDEVFVAHCERKPIVLMFLEQVPVKTMPKTLQKLYMCHGRSKWTLNDKGEYILTPSWDSFCDTLCEIIVCDTPL